MCDSARYSRCSSGVRAICARRFMAALRTPGRALFFQPGEPICVTGCDVRYTPGASSISRVERVTLPNGVEVELEIIRHKGASAVAAVDDAARVVLIRQFRHAAGGYLWELPAGVLDHRGRAAGGVRAARAARGDRACARGALAPARRHLDHARLQRRAHPSVPGARPRRRRRIARDHDEVIAEIARVSARRGARHGPARRDRRRARRSVGLHLARRAREAA